MKIDADIENTKQSGDLRDLLKELRAIMRADGGDMQQHLQAIVALISEHLRAEVCSLYQIDDSDGSFVLKATKGLRMEAVGRTRLRPGEGLVGTVAESRQPLALENAQADERFAFRPETGEEIYQSFLGVPLVRVQTLHGVLVLQHRQRRNYTEEEIEDCETIAQFLSEMLNRGPVEAIAQPDADLDGSHWISAVALSPGLAIGNVVLYLKDILIHRWQAADSGPELVRLEDALQNLQSKLELLLLLPDTVADPEKLEILQTDLMLVRDKGWRQKIVDAIGQGLTVEAAVQSVRENLKERMQAISNAYIRERLQDIDELSYRLLAELTNQNPSSLNDGLPPSSILVCRSLGLPELLHLDRENLAGLVVTDATSSSHLAIIARSLKIPALGQAPEALAKLQDGDRIVVDAINGQLIIRPSDSVVAEFETHIVARQKRDSQARSLSGMPCRSRDGIVMRLLANAGLLLDLDEIVPLETDGIGLYRTEMAFLIRDHFPSVKEQAQLYRRIYDRMGDKPVVFRTLDIGSDKELPYFDDHRNEANPALGWRAIRIALDQPDLLRDQLRALLTAAEGRALQVMFPMITEVEEFEAARALLFDLLKDHQDQGGLAPTRLEAGVMIEVPALLWDLDRLLGRVDFASVGTNDLFQFLTAADRNNARTNDRFDVLKPGNLRMLSMIAETASRLDTPVSVCGEMCGSPLGLLALVGCGFRAFSMSAVHIAHIKAVIGSLDVGIVEERIQALSCLQVGSVRKEIEILAQDLGVEIL
ncbi:MAG: phosphoenolpyruvate--protein phosphotransferase [Rhodospirillales bacterium]|nr:phosphoenolpyruvate--protein phosphotransferase [Rhodospirillales bacterium]